MVLSSIEEMEKQIEFDDLLHKYWVNGKEVISVTQLLKKHEIGNDYSFVNKELLETSALRGNIIHKDIEEYINLKKTPKTEEGLTYYGLLKKNDFVPLRAEFKVGNDIVAGKVDAILKKGNDLYINDHKTGSYINKLAVSWQCSLYAYLLGVYDNVKGIICSHLPKNDYAKLIELELIPKHKIEKLLECERNGELYIEETFEIYNVAELELIEERILYHKQLLKELQEQELVFRNNVLNEMQKRNLLKVSFGNISFTRISGTIRETVDGKRLKEEMPELYEKYLIKTNVKESIRVKVGNKND